MSASSVGPCNTHSSATRRCWRNPTPHGKARAALSTRRCCKRTRRWQVMKRICPRSEEHTSELQSLMRISYAVFCLKKKTGKEIQQSLLDSNISCRISPSELSTSFAPSRFYYYMCDSYYMLIQSNH